MSKYIDADKLIAEINKRLMSVNLEELGNFGSHRIWAYNDVKDIIGSLQQEQPKVDLVSQLKHYLDTTPKEKLEKDWTKLEPYGNIGPTVQEFLFGNQPEVDLEKEYEEYVVSDPVYSKLVNDIVGMSIARHFYELGLNARKEG